MIKTALICFLLSSVLSGCATVIPIEKSPGTLNLQSKSWSKSQPVKNVIAIVSPKVTSNSVVARAQTQAPVSQNPFAAMMMQRMNTQNIDFNFNSAFSTNYSVSLNKALESSISEVVTSKGFKLKGPYSVFDDITYQDKKRIYLALVPEFDFSINRKIINQKKHRLYTHTKGIIQIGGSLTVSMMEPMTGQVFIKRRINLSDFNIEEPYIREKQTHRGGNGLIGTALDKGTAPDKLIDTTDVALTNAVNAFYVKAIDKIYSYIDKEEILSFNEDVLKLKGLKRF